MRRTPPRPLVGSIVGAGGVDRSLRRPSPGAAPRSYACATVTALAIALPMIMRSSSTSWSSSYLCHAMAALAGGTSAGPGGRGGGAGFRVGAGGTPPEPMTEGPRTTAPTIPHMDPSRRSKKTSYAEARRVRALSGHDAAAPLYRELVLEGEPPPPLDDDDDDDDHRPARDMSAAARMAASYDSPRLHDEIFDYSDGREKELEEDAASLRGLLADSGYHSAGVHDAFGISSPEMWCAGPAFVRPVTAGEVGRLCPFDFRDAPTTSSDEGRRERSRNCLIALFLLGFALPRSTLSTCLLGSDASVDLLGRLGLVHPCEIDPDLIVPYAQLFPIDVDVMMEEEEEEEEEERSSSISLSIPRHPREGEVADGDGDDDGNRGEPSADGPVDSVDRSSSSTPERRSVVLATDWHPDVLSSSTVGRSGDGAVMYIGPDSLALVRHLPPPPPPRSSLESSRTRPPLRILDLCCGSGVQAICALASLGDGGRPMPMQPMPTCEDGKNATEGRPRSSSNSHRRSRRRGPRSDAAVAVCVDVNPRAVKFATFNALLNGFGDRVRAVRADLMELERDLVASSSMASSMGKEEDDDERRGVSTLAKLRGALGDLLPLDDDRDDREGDARRTARRGGGREENSPLFDLILANPPFIPTPSAQQGRLPKESDFEATATDYSAHNTEGRPGNTEDEGDGGSIENRSASATATASNISRRYGLFSDGGSDGEEVMGSIVRCAPSLLSKRPGSTLAVVSEFMNPGPDLCRKIVGWWFGGSEVEHEAAGTGGGGNAPVASSVGVLFTNQRLVSADTYASRRAGEDDDDDGNRDEFLIWRDHLRDRGITHVSPGLLFVARCATDRSQPQRRGEEGDVAEGTTTTKTSEDNATSLLSPPRTSDPPPPPDAATCDDGLDLMHSVVPRNGSGGSLWTPHNREAVSFTRTKWRDLVDSQLGLTRLL